MINQPYVGQRVVCINDRYSPYISEWCDKFPSKGQIYTIKSIHVCPDTFTRVWGIGLFLEELDNFNERFCYSGERFEPVVAAALEADEQLAICTDGNC